MEEAAMQNGEANAAAVDPAAAEASGGTAVQGDAAPRQRLMRRADLAQLLDAKLVEDSEPKEAPRAPDAWLERRLRVFERQMTVMETRQDQVEKNARAAAAAAEEAVKALQATVGELTARADAAEAKAKAVGNDLRTALNEAVLRLQTVESVAHAALAENHGSEPHAPVAAEPQIPEPVVDAPATPESEASPAALPEAPKSYLADVRKSVAAATAAAEVTTSASEKKAAKIRLNLTRYFLGSIVVLTIFAAGAGVAFSKQGSGTPKNPSEAVRWFSRAAGLGYVDSEFNLAVLYNRHGTSGLVPGTHEHPCNFTHNRHGCSWVAGPLATA
jgi:hypothetical protein